MKFIFSALLMTASLANASVDYVAIGKIVTVTNKEIQATQAAVACAVKSLAEKQTCQKIEELNNAFNKIKAPGIDSTHLSGCGIVSSGDYLRYYAKNLRPLAQEAKQTDAIWAIIEKVEKSIDQVIVDVDILSAKLRLQEIYTSQCLFGVEPTQTSLLDLVCK